MSADRVLLKHRAAFAAMHSFKPHRSRRVTKRRASRVRRLLRSWGIACKGLGAARLYLDSWDRDDDRAVGQ